ncbi:MAG: (deoxy)nucleoside triphosphate pyrophosphohydrolase [Tissierellales bacterium]|nr:(deoxy)nucleoside triphosphate pyrophosphohydrolase [Tissierellales bacterium]
MKHYTVTAAILSNENQILCMQRNKGKFDYISYKYEFPGGKVEEGETFEAGLSRELTEEMGVDVAISPNNFYMTVEHEYPDFKITMHSYLIEVRNREFVMKEHLDAKWLDANELKTLDWAEADKPIVEALMRDCK